MNAITMKVYNVNAGISASKAGVGRCKERHGGVYYPGRWELGVMIAVRFFFPVIFLQRVHRALPFFKSFLTSET